MPQRTSPKHNTPIFGLAMLLALFTAAEPLVGVLSRHPVLAQSPSFSPPSVVPTNTTVKVDGSSSMATINQALKKTYEKKYAGTRVTLAEDGSEAALKALLDGTIDLAAIGRALTEQEQQKGLVAQPIARHKIAIIVGPDNPFTGNITFEQFAKIFRGEIKDWSELGGAPGAIRFVDRPDFSDTRQAFRPYPVFQKAPFRTGEYTKQTAKDSTDEVVQALGTDGIGYAIADQVFERKDVRIISMHKTLPDDPRYPFSQPLAYVYKGTPGVAVLSFLSVATAPETQPIIEAARATDAKVATGASPTPASPSAAPSATAPSSPAASPPATPAIASAPPAAKTETEGVSPWWLLLLPLVGIPLWLWLKGQRPAVNPAVDPTVPPTMGTSTPASPPPIAPPVAAVPPASAVSTGASTGDAAIAGSAALGAAGLAGAGLAGASKEEVIAPVASGLPVVEPPAIETPIETPTVEPPVIVSPVSEIPPVEPPLPTMNPPEGSGLPGAAIVAGGLAAAGAAGLAGAGLAGAGASEEGAIAPLEATPPDIEPPIVETPAVAPPAAALPPVEPPLPTVNPSEGSGFPGAAVVAGGLAAAAGVAALTGIAGGGETSARSKITLVPYDSQQAFAEWEAPDAHKSELRHQGGRTFSLRLYDVTGLNLVEQRPQSFQEFSVGENAVHHTVAIRADRDYLAEIGYLTEDRYWLLLARSNSIRIPSTATTNAGAAAIGGATLAAGAGLATLAALSNDQAQANVEAAKYNVGQTDLSSEALASVDEGLPDLPDGYGESRIVLMPRDPQWGYAYWDVPNDHKEELRRQGGQRLALRLYDVTNVDLQHQSAHSLQQYDCDELARDWYVPIPVSDRDYVAEIGYLTGEGHWLLLARSNPVRIPPIYPSDWLEDRFLAVTWDDNLRGKTLLELISPETRSTTTANPIYDQVFGLTQTAEALRVAGSLFGSMQHIAGSMQQMPEQSVSSYIFPSGVGMGAVPGAMPGMLPGVPTFSGLTMSGLTMSGVGMSGIGFGASMPPLRARKFWLVADAELIVYGATEPDATVTIDGRPIQLNPDGTFRFQMSFQDGRLNFPIIAVAADGEQTRSIHMTFDRKTPHRHTNTKDEAVDELF